nr:MAK10-like protein [Tanacetum cinerariifolium]
MGDANHIRTLRDYTKPSYEGYRNTIELPVWNNVVPLRSDTIWLVQNRCSFHGLRRTIDQSVGGKLRDRNAKESYALLEDLALYENESWNDPRDFSKPVKAIYLPQDILSTSDRRLIKLENQVQRLMEAHLAMTRPTQVNKITTSCEICSGPMTLSIAWKILNKSLLIMHPCEPTGRETFTNPWNKSFSTYISSYQMNLEKELIDFDSHQKKRLSSLRTQLGQQQDDMISKINLLWKAVYEKLDDALIRNTAGNPAA